MCEHKRQRSQCIACVPVSVALAKGWLCVLCCDTITRRGLCSKCHKTKLTDIGASIECLTLRSIHHFYPYSAFNGKATLGGEMCAMQINGSGCKDEESGGKVKTKRAYPDFYIQGENTTIIVEVDENSHQNYPTDCELKRYDTLKYGQSDISGVLHVIRFNPHINAEHELPFLDRVKQLVKLIEDLLHKDPEEVLKEQYSAHVHYMYYGSKSPHPLMAKSVPLTLTVVPFVETSDLPEKIAQFKIEDLCEGGLAIVSETLINQYLEETSSEKCCLAKRRNGSQCSSRPKKGADVCNYHFYKMYPPSVASCSPCSESDVPRMRVGDNDSFDEVSPVEAPKKKRKLAH
jgi:hypothetical protein